MNKKSLVISLLVLVIVSILIISTYYLVNLLDEESYEIEITNAMQTNENGNSMSFVWVTNQAMQTYAQVSEIANDLKGEIRFDDRDYLFNSKGDQELKSDKGSYYTHQATFSELKPETKYLVSILSDRSKVIENYEIETGKVVDTELIKDPDIAYGRVVDGNGNPVVDSIIISAIADSNKQIVSNYLSSITNSNGGWNVNFALSNNSASSSDSKEYEVFTILANDKFDTSFEHYIDPEYDSPVDSFILIDKDNKKNYSKASNNDVLGESTCNCDTANGEYSDRYCGKTGNVTTQTIDGFCYEVVEHINAIASFDGLSCENPNHVYNEKGKKLSDGPCDQEAGNNANITDPNNLVANRNNPKPTVDDVNEGGQGKYCVGNSVCFCKIVGDETVCSQCDDCNEKACNNNVPGKEAFCEDIDDDGNDQSTTTGGITEAKYNAGGTGEYCVDGVIKYCSSASDCKQIDDCDGLGCYEAPPTLPDKCNSPQKQEASNARGVYNPTAEEKLGDSCNSSPDCGGTGLVCDKGICTDQSKTTGNVYYSQEYSQSVVTNLVDVRNILPVDLKSLVSISGAYKGSVAEVNNAIANVLRDPKVQEYLCEGCAFHLNSSYRSWEEQASFRDPATCGPNDQWNAPGCGGAAPPGFSQHHSGRALDIYIMDPNRINNSGMMAGTNYNYIDPNIKNLLESYGFTFPIANDLPHAFFPEEILVPAYADEDINDEVGRAPFGIITKKVYAQSNVQNTNITISNGIIDLLESGTYSFNSDQYVFGINDLEVYVMPGEAIRVVLFDDKNKNGIKDEGEVVLENTDHIQLSKTRTPDYYELGEGWSTIALTRFDYENGIKNASQLLNSINSQGGDAYHIFTFFNGKFYLYSEGVDGSIYGNDFNLVPGHAYFIRNYRSFTFVLNGQSVLSSPTYKLMNGWNLIGFPFMSKEYNASEIINRLEENKLKPESLMYFQAGRYKGITNKNGVIYGDDFGIDSRKGYFLKINTEEHVNWTAEL